MNRITVGLLASVVGIAVLANRIPDFIATVRHIVKHLHHRTPPHAPSSHKL